jgi:hypothetical protein
MLHEDHPIIPVIKQWRKKAEINKPLKEETFTVLAPHVQTLLANTTLTCEQKQQLEKKTENIKELIDKHINTLNLRKIFE